MSGAQPTQQKDCALPIHISNVHLNVLMSRESITSEHHHLSLSLCSMTMTCEWMTSWDGPRLWPVAAAAHGNETGRGSENGPETPDGTEIADATGRETGSGKGRRRRRRAVTGDNQGLNQTASPALVSFTELSFLSDLCNYYFCFTLCCQVIRSCVSWMQCNWTKAITGEVVWSVKTIPDVMLLLFLFLP